MLIDLLGVNEKSLNTFRLIPVSSKKRAFVINESYEKSTEIK